MSNPIIGSPNNNESKNNSKQNFLNELSKDIRVWIAGALVIIVLIVVAIVNTHTEPAKENRAASAYVLSDNDSDEIKKLIKNAIIDCGTWGLNTSIITKDNASDFKDMAYKYAMGTDKPIGDDAKKAISRQDERKNCLYDYFSDLSPYQNDVPDASQYDAMMSYTIESNNVDVSNPKDSKLSINNNSSSSLTVKASWSSLEAGYYQPQTATLVAKPDGGSDVSLQSNGTWEDLSKEHKFKDMEIMVEKDNDNKWKIVEVNGSNWKTDGYVMSFSPYTTAEKGADRLMPPTPEAPANMNTESNSNNSSNSDKSAYDGSQNVNDSCIDPETGQAKSSC